jgi:hypothetical protein
MAVQPDKRSREAQLRELGLNLTERFRVGEYTLQAPAMTPNPRSFELRWDRPGLDRESSGGVYLDLHEGWVMHHDGTRFVSRVSPLECLEWFVSRQ